MPAAACPALAPGLPPPPPPPAAASSDVPPTLPTEQRPLRQRPSAGHEAAAPAGPRRAPSHQRRKWRRGLDGEVDLPALRCAQNPPRRRRYRAGKAGRNRIDPRKGGVRRIEDGQRADGGGWFSGRAPSWLVGPEEESVPAAADRGRYGGRGGSGGAVREREGGGWARPVEDGGGLGPPPSARRARPAPSLRPHEMAPLGLPPAALI